MRNDSEAAAKGRHPAVKQLFDSLGAVRDALDEAMADAEALGLLGTYQLLDEALSAVEAAQGSVVPE